MFGSVPRGMTSSIYDSSRWWSKLFQTGFNALEIAANVALSYDEKVEHATQMKEESILQLGIKGFFARKVCFYFVTTFPDLITVRNVKILFALYNDPLTDAILSAAKSKSETLLFQLFIEGCFILSASCKNVHKDRSQFILLKHTVCLTTKHSIYD